ncbi:hypothetical protein [Legionella resiliens]|uniref:Uncharacterized protein n=1 Tax=Legionella resiliens TaxID=2905958 RepID=A0ABS8WZ75_9GAMM|nr:MULTISPECIES: hypothetical protein [unclassified Legionella]MCE0722621.1 hypothetical protein [Legionella sp. 9fVS26]MCE3531775.1 hypothetical protein [Legionella sp. 8cVS16]
MKQFEVLRSTTISVRNITLTTKGGHRFSFDITLDATSKFGTYFLQRVMTPMGAATVIGVYNDNLWFWVDGDKGITYWDNIHGNIFDAPVLITGYNDNDYPEEVKKAIQFALGVIQFNFDGKFDLLYILSKINILSPEFICVLVINVLTINPQEMNQQLDLFFKEFESLTALDIERLAELGNLIHGQENKFNTHFITDTPLDTLSEKHVENIRRAALDCQTCIDVINGQIKLLDKSNVPLLYADLNSLKLNLEKSLNNIEQGSREIKAVSSDIARLKKVYNFQHFNSLLELIMNAFFEFQIKQMATPRVKFYLEAAAKITQFLYNHGHHFFEKSGEELTHDKGKQESSGSLNLLELMYLFLLLSGTSASSNLKACVYLKLLKALNIKLNEHENMPNSFDLLNFVTGNPDGFITLYQHFFTTEGPLKQKVEELLKKQHPILLTEFGKLTYYYAIALKTRSEERFFAHAQFAIKLNFIKGTYYLRQALSQGNPFAAEEMVTFLSSQYRFQIDTFEMEKDLALYFLNRKELVKARSYLERALLSFKDKRGKNILDQYELDKNFWEEEELHLIQIKIDILQKSGNEQKQAIEELIQRSRLEEDNPARDLLNELSTQLPVVAFAAVVEWHKTDLNKLSLKLLQLAAKENHGIIAWYQNDYQVVYLNQNPDLGLILKAVKVNFAPAIIDFNTLLKSSSSYARDYKDEILPLLSDFEMWQHIDPNNLTSLLLTYIDTNLSRTDLSKFIQSLAHASFNNPEKHLEYLTTVLKNLSALIDTGDLMSILYAIKRVGSFAKMDTEVRQAIAFNLVGSQFDRDKSILCEMANAFPGLILALYEDPKAWNIIKSNHPLVALFDKTLDHNPHDQDTVVTYEGTALTNLSLFKPSSHDPVNSTQPQEMPMESSDITTPQ